MRGFVYTLGPVRVTRVVPVGPSYARVAGRARRVRCVDTVRVQVGRSTLEMEYTRLVPELV